MTLTEKMIEAAHLAYWRSWMSRGMEHDKTMIYAPADGHPNMRAALKAALECEVAEALSEYRPAIIFEGFKENRMQFGVYMERKP